MSRELVSVAGLIGVVISLSKAVTERSVGWGSVAICLMIFLAAWSVGHQLTRAINRLDDIARVIAHSDAD
jgi:hypothetical protein